MRTVSFVRDLELSIDAGVFASAMLLVDVDGDCLNELVVGTHSGELYIFKGLQQTKSLWQHSGLGMITAICCGDLMATGGTCICVTAANGLTNVLQVDGSALKLLHSQRLPANVKASLLCDVDADGRLELVVALTDRVVRVYRWDGATIRAVSKCELMQQVGNIAVGSDGDVLVSQPGATVVRLRFRSELGAAGVECLGVQIDDVTRPVKARQSVSCEVLTSVAAVGSTADASGYALATSDGALMFIRGEQLEWTMALHHQLFCLHRIDVTAAGSSELVVSAWDGRTFFVDERRRCVQFRFNDAVLGFVAGQYGGDAGQAPSLVYATPAGRVAVFHGVRLPAVCTESLTQKLQRLRPWTRRLRPDQQQQLYRWCLYGLPAALQAAAGGSVGSPSDTAEPHDSSASSGFTVTDGVSDCADSHSSGSPAATKTQPTDEAVQSTSPVQSTDPTRSPDLVQSPESVQSPDRAQSPDLVQSPEPVQSDMIVDNIGQ